MIEREKQRDDQRKKHAEEKERREHPAKDVKVRSDQQQAGMASDPKAMEDKGYVERIEEKTNKH